MLKVEGNDKKIARRFLLELLLLTVVLAGLAQ
jgi:hypothetical protein